MKQLVIRWALIDCDAVEVSQGVGDGSSYGNHYGDGHGNCYATLQLQCGVAK